MELLPQYHQVTTYSYSFQIDYCNLEFYTDCCTLCTLCK